MFLCPFYIFSRLITSKLYSQKKEMSPVIINQLTFFMTFTWLDGKMDER